MAKTDNDTTHTSDGFSSIDGEWEVNGDDGVLALELELGEEARFDSMPDTWEVLEYNSSLIKLKNVNSEDGSETTMILQVI